MMDSEQKQDSGKEIALLEMQSLVYEEMDLDVIEERFVSLVAEIFDFDRVALFYAKHNKGTLKGKLCKGFKEGVISSLEVPINAENILTNPLITGFPILSGEAEYDPLLDRVGIDNFALIPIVNKKRLPCWQIKKCDKKCCPAFGKRWLRCWLVPGMQCNEDNRGTGDYSEICGGCEVYAQQDVETGEGVLLVDNTPSGDPVTFENVFLLSIIAHSVGVAINNTKVYSRTLREAIHDDLTGLPNRRHFNERLLDEVERGKRYGGVFSLLLCDIDRFKKVNDDFGHPTGDRVLVRVASTLQENLRSSDIVARYGGEEFAILLFNTGREEAGRIAENLRRLLAEKSMPEIGEQKVTASFGVVSFDEDSSSFEGLISKVDKALYSAKLDGRNRVGMGPFPANNDNPNP